MNKNNSSIPNWCTFACKGLMIEIHEHTFDGQLWFQVALGFLLENGKTTDDEQYISMITEIVETDIETALATAMPLLYPNMFHDIYSEFSLIKEDGSVERYTIDDYYTNSAAIDLAIEEAKVNTIQ